MPLELMRKKCCHLLDEFKNGGRGSLIQPISLGSIRDPSGMKMVLGALGIVGIPCRGHKDPCKIPKMMRVTRP